MNSKVIAKPIAWLLILALCIGLCADFTGNARDLTGIGQTIVKPVILGLKSPVIEVDASEAWLRQK